jgi:hypothetical protein
LKYFFATNLSTTQQNKHKSKPKVYKKMSSSTKQSTTKQSTTKQSTTKQSTMKNPFCKVCFDAGKDSAHPLRNAAGQTVCTYLLSIFCNNCHKTGHTVKYCTSPKRFNSASSAQLKQAPAKQAPAKQAPAKQAPAKQAPVKQKTHFEAFQQLISKEEIQEQERECEELARRLQEIAHKTNFPQISSKNVSPKKTSDSILTGWSKAVGKPVKVYETLSEEEENSLVEEKKEVQVKQAQVQQAQVQQVQVKQAQVQQDEDPEEEEDEKEEEQSEYRPTYTSWADCF